MTSKIRILSQYVRQGTHFTGCVDFKPMVKDDDEELDTPIIYENYNHSDMKKCIS
jgi:hypothetical protein